MKELHRAVYLRAREYWNTRFNDFHIPVSYDYARQLLLAHPDADPDVVAPAILLHDNGWKSIPEDDAFSTMWAAYQHLRASGGKAQAGPHLRFHETEGARIANDILSAVNFDSHRRELIVQIIDGHDTRREALSLEDALVKDADRLWRFTPAAIDLYHRNFKVPLAELLAGLGQQADGFMLTECGKEMACTALAEIRRAVEEVGYV